MGVNVPDLLKIARDAELLEIGRQAIEHELVEWRDSGISTLRNNGFVIKSKDGKLSNIIRFGPEVGIKIALEAIAKHLESLEKPNAEEIPIPDSLKSMSYQSVVRKLKDLKEKTELESQTPQSTSRAILEIIEVLEILLNHSRV